MTPVRTSRIVLALSSLLFLLTVGSSTPAASQEPDTTTTTVEVPSSAADVTSIEPAADFRTAPTVSDGTYVVDIVAGERVWVSALYTNDTELTVTARLTDIDVDANDELTLIRTIVGPNLGVLTSDAEDIGPGQSMSWSGADTNLWFLSFTLETTGQRGQRHQLEFAIDGFVDAGSQEPCDADCTLDDDLSAAEAELEDLQAQLDECGADCGSTEETEARIADLQTSIDNENAAIAELCGGEVCDSLTSEASTPWPLVALLALVTLGAGVGGLITRKRRAAPAT